MEQVSQLIPSASGDEMVAEMRVKITIVGSGPPTAGRLLSIGGQKQIVYYWFKQRDRWITSEYLVKFFLFWDSLTRHRADGALIRLTSSVHAGESEAVADQRLQTLAGLVTPLLDRYVPD